MVYNIKTTPVPMRHPNGTAFSIRFKYGISCEICHKPFSTSNMFLVDINLALRSPNYSENETDTSYTVCPDCYIRTVTFCRKLFNDKDMLPLYINDGNIFVKYFVEKTLKG